MLAVAGTRDVAILRLLHDLGLRRGELVALDAEHVDLANRKLPILGKGRSERETLTVPQPTSEALAAWLAERGPDAGPLFVTHANPFKGRGLSSEAVRQMVTRRAKQAGIDNVRAHALRHTGITTALERTRGNISAVARFSRHATIETVKRYDDDRRDVAGELAALVAEGCSLLPHPYPAPSWHAQRRARVSPDRFAEAVSAKGVPMGGPWPGQPLYIHARTSRVRRTNGLDNKNRPQGAYRTPKIRATRGTSLSDNKAATTNAAAPRQSRPHSTPSIVRADRAQRLCLPAPRTTTSDRMRSKMPLPAAGDDCLPRAPMISALACEPMRTPRSAFRILGIPRTEDVVVVSWAPDLGTASLASLFSSSLKGLRQEGHMPSLVGMTCVPQFAHVRSVLIGAGLPIWLPAEGIRPLGM